MQAFVQDALEEGGFASDVVSSGEEALTVLLNQAKSYKALVTDVNLKGRLTGWDVARRMREREPAFPVIYMTGASAGEWASQGVPNSILLAKTVRVCAAPHRYFESSEYRLPAQSLMPRSQAWDGGPK